MPRSDALPASVGGAGEPNDVDTQRTAMTSSRWCKNMGAADRVLRGLLALTLFWLVASTDWLTAEPVLAGAVAVFATVNLFASASARCPMYYLTGTDTRLQAT